MRHESVSEKAEVELQAALARIKNSKHSFDMSYWGQVYGESSALDEHTFEGVINMNLRDCKTALCLAGEICVGNPTAKLPILTDASKAATIIADLTSNQADRLFHVTRWPEKFSDMYGPNASLDAPTREVKERRIAALEARISHFILTGQ